MNGTQPRLRMRAQLHACCIIGQACWGTFLAYKSVPMSDSPRMSRGRSQGETLQQQCMQFILMNLEELPPSYLALLPLSIRKEILDRLPIADVCLLEETPFVDGLDLKVYWSDCLEDLCHYFGFSTLPVCPEFEEVCERKWGSPKFAKIRFYSQVARIMFDRSCYILPFGFLFATRCFVFGQWFLRGNLEFPPRYVKYNNVAYVHTKYTSIAAAVEAFRGRPHLLYLGPTMTDKKPFNAMLDFVSDLECFQVSISTKRRFKVAQQVIEKATNCEYLSLEYSHGRPINIPDIVSFLKSSLRVVIISKLVLTYESLQRLIKSFLTLPCDHPQKLELKAVTIQDVSGEMKCNLPNISYWPELQIMEQSYVHLKTVKIRNCTIKASELVLYWPLAREEKAQDQDGSSNSKGKKKRLAASSRAMPQRSSKRLRKN